MPPAEADQDAGPAGAADPVLLTSCEAVGDSHCSGISHIFGSNISHLDVKPDIRLDELISVVKQPLERARALSAGRRTRQPQADQVSTGMSGRRSA